MRVPLLAGPTVLGLEGVRGAGHVAHARRGLLRKSYAAGQAYRGVGGERRTGCGGGGGGGEAVGRCERWSYVHVYICTYVVSTAQAM